MDSAGLYRKISKPLRERFVISHHQGIAESRSEFSGRPSSYKNYSESKLYQAYEEVLLGKSIRQAATEYGVPTTTLFDRVSGRVPFGKKGGPSKYLSDSEEGELVNFIVRNAEIGYSYSRQDIIGNRSRYSEPKRNKHNCDTWLVGEL